MGCLFNPQGSGCTLLMMQVFAVQLVGMLACLAFTVLAQFELSEAVTGSASFPDVAITCVGNLAVFFSCLLRGRLHVEMGARDLLATITAPKLEKVGSALRTRGYFPDVVMLSNQTPASSIRQFMQYIQNTQDVGSVLLQFHSLELGEFNAQACINDHGQACRCIVIESASVFYIGILASRMPGVLKRLSGSQFLLPCLTCLTNRCHGCNHGMLHVREMGEPWEWTLIEGGPMEWPTPAVCEILDKDVISYIDEEPSCICIPRLPAEDDRWTEMLIRCLMKTKDKEDRGVTNLAAEALQNYIAQSGVCDAEEEYDTLSLILPRVAEILVNIILTAWFRVDGFSTSLTARRVIRDYIVDCRGTGIAANAFLKKCQVYSTAENAHVCQLLSFRGSLLNFRTFSFIIGGVNLICSISWCVLIAIPGMNWYDTQSMAPSKARIGILIAAIGIALLMDCLQFYLYHIKIIQEMPGTGKLYKILLFVMFLEIVCIIGGSALLGTLGIKGFGRWTYSAIQVLVWVKWGFGCCFLGAYSIENRRGLAQWAFDVSASHGLMCASAFLLNAVLAGVRGHWKYSQS